ncbi:GTP 3',8-cyclase MoaA [Candidatus Hydrogenedentota bacterium]
MLDRFDRRINYLRVSVIDRCQHRCVYCMPEEGVKLFRHENILSLEEIRDVVHAAVGMGVTKVRLTGGEPLLRRGILTLLSMLSEIDGIEDLAMTTNGVRLVEFAQPLTDTGLHRVNISLDTLDAGRYAEITRGGDIAPVLAGISAAREAGLLPLKLNCVVQQNSREQDAQAVAEFARIHGYEVRFIRRMSLSDGKFWKVEGGTGGDCSLCNRLRLSSDGMIRPCLFSDLAFSVKELGAEEALKQAVTAKPESGKASENNAFHEIGG